MRFTLCKFTVFAFFLISCNTDVKVAKRTYPDVKIVGAMKNVMWEGDLEARINLDTLSNRDGLYGLGPESYLKGEILINDGKSYISRVASDSTLMVDKTFNTSAPFFVYAYVDEWVKIELPSKIKTIADLESFIDQHTSEYKRPFAFKLKGLFKSALIHSQNLPDGTKVSSPDEAHQGQTNYELKDAESEIIGFFSTEHKGVFTHHDSFLHMHLITNDETMMGHLDELIIAKMDLYLPIH